MKIIVTSAERDVLFADEKAIEAIQYLHDALGTGEGPKLWAYPPHVTATHSKHSDRPVINGHTHSDDDNEGQQKKPRGVGHTTGVRNPS